MEGTADLLTAELNELLERIGCILSKIENELPPEECIKRVEGVFSRLLVMMGNRLRTDKIHKPAERQNATLYSNTEDPTPLNNNHENVCLSSDRVESASPPSDRDTASEESSCSEHNTIDHHQSNYESSNLDKRFDLYKPVSMSQTLYDALIKYEGNPHYFLNSTYPPVDQITGGLAGAIFRLHEKSLDIEDEKIRDMYLQMYSLYRRFEYRNIFLLARESGYHTGDRWRTNACQQLTAQIKAKCPSLDVGDQLEEYVRLGRAYNKWAEALGGPGSLLMLPVTVTEYQYTGREYSRYFSSAVKTLQKHDIKNIVATKGLDVLGEKICDELWARSQEEEGPLQRPPTKSAPRKRMKRKAKMNENNRGSEDDPLQRPPTKSAPRKRRKRKAKMNENNRGSEDDQRKRRQKLRNTQSEGISLPDIDSSLEEQEHDQELNATTDCPRDSSNAADPISSPFTSLHDSLDTITSLIPGSNAELPDAIDMASLVPGGDAEFPDAIDMASLMPGGDAEFPDAIDIASLMPGGDAEFPDAIDMASLMPGGDAEFPDAIDMASLMPGGDAEFPDAIDMASLMPGGDAEFPDAIDMASFMPEGSEDFPDTINIGGAQILGAIRPSATDVHANCPRLNYTLSAGSEANVSSSRNEASVAQLVQI